ncbi:MAG: rRNA pseudouridine synthase [Candidatus Pacebacteria bacterium]|jgi:pseudouridine synthase|nr:rRNA pseudouridine synthase [Candidatus Paceibacterota bacterium]MBP9700833.1 rRNA pseudouridine synthase [Candidatus Paceibacterota bacterium]
MPVKQPTTLPKGQERLEKVMAHLGLASRREAKDLITKGKVSVNGVVVTEPGHGIIPGKDTIEVKGVSVKESYLVYKPRGIETTKTTPTAKDLHDTFKKLRHLSPIGRLDKDSEGLIIMSNDGTLTKALTKEDSHVGKTYLVTVRENVSDASILKMARGIVLDKVMTKPAVTKRASRTSFTITLYEGRKHQIRRMCDACRLTITSLVRTSIGHLKYDGMKPGNVKKLAPSDIELLKS